MIPEYAPSPFATIGARLARTTLDEPAASQGRRSCIGPFIARWRRRLLLPTFRTFRRIRRGSRPQAGSHGQHDLPSLPRVFRPRRSLGLSGSSDSRHRCTK